MEIFNGGRIRMKKSYYKCGHDGKPIILNYNPLTYADYLNWANTTGYDGDKTECWYCYCKK